MDKYIRKIKEKDKLTVEKKDRVLEGYLKMLRQTGMKSTWVKRYFVVSKKMVTVHRNADVGKILVRVDFGDEIRFIYHDETIDGVKLSKDSFEFIYGKRKSLIFKTINKNDINLWRTTIEATMYSYEDEEEEEEYYVEPLPYEKPPLPKEKAPSSLGKNANYSDEEEDVFFEEKFSISENESIGKFKNSSSDFDDWWDDSEDLIDLPEVDPEEEKKESEKLLQEALEREEKEKAEKERLAKEKAEKERLEKEKAEKERLAKEKAEKERLAKEKAEKERLEKEKADKEHIEKEEQLMKQKLSAVQKKKEEKERLMIERERLRLEKTISKTKKTDLTHGLSHQKNHANHRQNLLKQKKEAQMKNKQFVSKAAPANNKQVVGRPGALKNRIQNQNNKINQLQNKQNQKINNQNEKQQVLENKEVQRNKAVVNKQTTLEKTVQNNNNNNSVSNVNNRPTKTVVNKNLNNVSAAPPVRSNTLRLVSLFEAKASTKSTNTNWNK
eukprot:TRINITY_DN2517_c0_g1_i3.p1 TRINITY_DN2517_c0_g1~~TRINITY_DN2517_c0_g1_i3.p1  ORF type:complete len:575 (-),score=226.50 TRINITY_DN2517_c0_g1_i3:299-1792(-)